MATESDSFSEKDPKRTRKNGDRSVIATDHGGSAVAALPDLPYEIVVDILSRLPVKSLLRFRCVRKSWLSLISDPKFVRMHLHMSTVDDNYSHHRLIVLGRHKKLTSCKSWTLNSIYSDQCDDLTDLDFMMKESFWDCHLFGYCDGLICMRFDEGDFFVWNPHLKESRRLGFFEVEADLGLPVNWEYYFVYGFGYDCSVDDYKVVAMLCLPHNNNRVDTEVRVCTLRNNSWRRIQDFPNGCGPCENCDQPAGIFVGGSLHWLSIDRSVGLVSKGNDSRDSKKIIALDLATEIFHEVALPTYGFTDELVLGVIRGCLCVAIVYTDTRLTDLWMLKEYGVRESWTRLASFPYFSNSPGPGFRTYHTPLFVSRTNVLLWKFRLGIILYNLKDNTFRSSVAENFFSYIYNSAIYIESLVSPNAERLY